MAKGTKKKPNRKLRRQIRKTIGALLMISAITVAAIPVQDVSAEPGVDAQPQKKVWVWDTTQQSTKGKPADSIAPFCESTIPYVPDNSIVYTSGDGRFQFSYVDPGNGIKVAVILNYNPTVLTDSTLEIPNTVEAFRKYKTTSTEGYYCLVTKDDEFMFYDVYEQDRDSSNRLLYSVPEIKYDTDKHPVPPGDTVHHVGDSIVVNQDQLVTRDGKLVYVERVIEQDEENRDVEVEKIYQVDQVMVTHQKPCYYEARNVWGDKDDTELYYQVKNSVTSDKPDGELVHPMEQNHYRINADVKYIGQQFIDAILDSDGNLTGWKVRTGEYRDEPNEGVFANNANITNLVIGEKLSGISDYAFQGCSTLQSVSFGNDLTTIGNGAFANCIRLSNCNMESNSNIQALGKDAFYNCTALTNIMIPINVKAIGDSCFEGCLRLQSIDLCGGSNLDTMLQVIGNSAFKNCASLGSVTLPTQYNEADLQIGIFEGCSSLQYVQVQNRDMNFVDTVGGYTFEKFKETVPNSFYFIGPLPKSEEDRSKSSIHRTANDKAIAFKYPDQELYEVVKEEKASTGTSPDPARITYQVNNQNELVKVWIEGQPENITLPETIGPYGISSIGAGSFNDNCTLGKITIPASVTSIGDNAFKGCHELKTVIFTDASTMQSIGTDAFKTQVVTCTHTCSDPKLTFVGAMMNSAGADTVPFIYAMNGVSNINNPNQEKIWITCHSGWPTNLEVQYNFDPLTQTGEAQLVGYPRYEMINDALKAADWVSKLPYVTTENQTEYTNMVTKATKYYEYKKDPDHWSGPVPEQPTENEMAIVTSTLNVAIPSSVDSIKPGLFSGYTYDENGEAKPVAGITSDEYIQTILFNGVDEVEPYTFKGCTALKSADLIGSEFIGDYAFDGCTSLEVATLGEGLQDIGLRPFRGCTAMTTINSLTPNYWCRDGVLYQKTDEGTEIVECLEGRGGNFGSYSVGPDELSGVTSIKEEAFMGCSKVGKVDLSSSTVDVIPEKCFSETSDLNTVVLPDTVKNIEADSFKDSKIRLLTIPGMQAYIAQDAFKSTPDQQTIIFECVEGTTADRYAKQYNYINPEYGKVNLEHTVYFWDYPNYPDTTTKSLFHKVKVVDGQDAVPPTSTPSHEGHPFSRWTDYTNIVRDTDVYPVFGENSYVVTFIDTIAGKELKVETVAEGKSATPPEAPTHDGYTFTGWVPDYHSITKDTTILTQYKDNSGSSSRHTVTFYSYDGKTIVSQQKVDHEGAATEPVPPTREGYTFTAWVPDTYKNVTQDLNIIASYTPVTPTPTPTPGTSPSASPSSSSTPSPTNRPGSTASPSPTPTPTPTTVPEVKKYTVSVSGGSGSGSYPAGAVVAVNAYFRGEGQSFDKWTSSTAGVGFADPNAASTTFTMPAANVAITATYKTGSTSSGGSGTGTNTGSSSSSGNGGSSSSGTSQSSNNGTTVQVTKPGISNTNLAGATVSGATDNFVIKVSEDQSAASAVVAALQAKYGDISRIKYLPMDISLYDSSGRTKIADTSGISVNMTLPLPDDLVQYAGNNKVAAVSNGTLEELNARFTTVDGVPCVNFTATHFSPYVVYVDTANLTAGTIDVTPKTGDPIHPKWFLALGMACVSLILFFKRDKAVVKTKTA
ncbi:MAG: leucine-rich repeat protein [Firmicutes bacterium]|nr:leucine-rich repeat protein [Bacillota bacterium]